MRLKWSIPIVLLMMLFSCKTPEYMKHIPYFENLPDSGQLAVQNAKINQIKLQSNDILDVKVIPLSGASIGMESSTASLSNEGASGNMNGGGGNVASGYMVDANGNISLPLIGDINVAGLTVSDAKKAIQIKADYYYKKPVVTVRLVNLKVSVLGEVAHPGVFTFTSEKIPFSMLLQAPVI